MGAKKTYELSISFTGKTPEEAVSVKQSVMHWLIGHGEESFVEGVVDGLNLDHDYEHPELDYFQKLGGDISPLLLYRYDLEYLRDIRAKLEHAFTSGIQCSETWLETAVWQEGWKASFKPFATEKFWVYPPWERSSLKTNLIPLEIEPGMAFGTGQHATTQLCLKEIERLAIADQNLPVLDVGAGTGILAIALAKLGYTEVTATDIDRDALRAAKMNAASNGVTLQIEHGSVPDLAEGRFILVIANILMVVIRRIGLDLCRGVSPGGYLLVSGVLEDEWGEMKELGEAGGLKFCHHREQDGWVALLFQKPST